MKPMMCPCCRLPTVPFGGEDICTCPCDVCRDDGESELEMQDRWSEESE